jgi:hypothetical protein
MEGTSRKDTMMQHIPTSTTPDLDPTWQRTEEPVPTADDRAHALDEAREQARRQDDDDHARWDALREARQAADA